VPIGGVAWPTSLFGSFTYDHGVVFGTYAQFGYNATTGNIRSFIGLEGRSPVLYLESIAIGGFPPARSAVARGPIFGGAGYLVTITAHDDPTTLLEIRSDMARLVTVELPPWSTNISLVSVAGSWRASSVSFVVQGEEARLFLGAGSFNVTGTTVLAHLASPDLLVFKSVPAGSANKAEWRAVLDAISAGHVVSELDLVAIADGGWIQNSGRYRIDVATWPLAVRAGRASVQVDTLRPGGAVVLLAFDPDTMPAADPMRLSVTANGNPVNRSNDPLRLLYAPDSLTKDASYSLLPLPGTVIALYLPSLAAVSVDVASVPLPAATSAFDSGSEAAVVAALAIVCVAAARMLRRRDG
jgi:hypothetical protein